jgi:hypothetical protein
VVLSVVFGRAAPDLPRSRPASRTGPRPAGARCEAPYDGFRVVRGVVLGCLLSVPAWIGIGLLVRAAL